MVPLARLDLTLPTMLENLALDEALLQAAEAGTGSECLRFWSWPTLAVVLGAGGSIAIDVNEDACRGDSVPIARRSSGGGTVLLGSGCLLFSLVLGFHRAAELRDIHGSYRWILGRVSQALSGAGEVHIVGISDLALGDRKFSGNAQQRKSRHLLHHGTLLFDFDLASLERYLHPPEREPKYRAGRSHDQFVRNLPFDRPQLECLLAEAFGTGGEYSPHSALEQVPGLIQTKYGREEWTRRR